MFDIHYTNGLFTTILKYRGRYSIDKVVTLSFCVIYAFIVTQDSVFLIPAIPSSRSIFASVFLLYFISVLHSRPHFLFRIYKSYPIYSGRPFKIILPSSNLPEMPEKKWSFRRDPCSLANYSAVSACW